MHPRLEAWRDYRRRRAVLLLAFLVTAFGGIAPPLFDVEGPTVLVFWLFACFPVPFAAIWLAAFPCPSCGNGWFGDRPNPDGDFASAVEGRTSLVGTLLRLAAQKLCCHCGLPKFMEPDRWD